MSSKFLDSIKFKYFLETKDEQNIIKEMKFANNWQFISDKLTFRQDVALSELHKASDVGIFFLMIKLKLNN